MFYQSARLQDLGHYPKTYLDEGRRTKDGINR